MTTAEPNYLESQGQRTGLAGWIFSTDHKRIGVLYLWSILIFFSVGVLIGVAMRLKMLWPGEHLYSAQAYNAFFTVHGVIQIFLFIIPGIPAAFGNFILPLQIGAKDVAFPRLNLLSWWCYVAGALLALTALFSGRTACARIRT